jgi:methylmalonyl-CoA/ethylmalonyl-CoA epimerase
MKLHHVGVVVERIDQQLSTYAECLDVKPIAPAQEDPIQKVRVQFIAAGQDGVTIELIEPLSEDSPAMNFLRKGGGLNHLCFEVPDIDRSISGAQKNGAILVSGPVPAAALDNRRIAFVFYRRLGLIEFLETTTDR